MKIKRVHIENFRGIQSTTIEFKDFNCIVGKNDAGKSTVLKALDLFFNDLPKDSLLKDNWYNSITKNNIVVSVDFVLSSATNEERVELDTFIKSNFIQIDNDIINIQRVWMFNQKNEDCSIGGNQFVFDAIKSMLPKYALMNANFSLDNAGLRLRRDLEPEPEFERFSKIMLQEISEDIRSITGQQLYISANFYSKDKDNKLYRNDEYVNQLPADQTGDGIRRLIEMAYFCNKNIFDISSMVIVLEEPEIHLHPELQIKLLQKYILSLVKKNCQIIISTHSPIIVSEVSESDVIHVTKVCGVSKYNCNPSVFEVITDLGMSKDQNLFELLDPNKLLLLVEGKNDIVFLRHIFNTYNQKYPDRFKTMDELGIIPISIGGCSYVKHWKNYKIIKESKKKFFIFLDSDKPCFGATRKVSKEDTNDKVLEKYFDSSHFYVTQKGEIENYIPREYFTKFATNKKIESLYNNLGNWGDFSDVKKECVDFDSLQRKLQKEAKRLHCEVDSLKTGGNDVIEKHFERLSYEELRSQLCHSSEFDETTGKFKPSNSDDDDEFIEIYNKITSLLKKHE